MRSTWKWVSWEEFKTELQNGQFAPWEIKQSWNLLLADGHDVHTERYGFLWMFKRTKILLLVKTEVGLHYNAVEYSSTRIIKKCTSCAYAYTVFNDK